MVSRLGHSINKTVLVSIPPIFLDARPRDCRVIGLEPTGLWLESAELWRTAFPDEERPSGAVFVPFTHIAFLVEARPPTTRPSPSARTDPPTRPVPPRPRGQGVANRKRRKMAPGSV
jgi:hypothetical protein